MSRVALRSGCVAVTVAALGIAAGCDEASPDTPEGASDSLTFTRPDGTTFVVSGATVRCGPGRSEQEDPPTEMLVVETAVEHRSGSGVPREPFFWIEALPADVADGTTIELPYQSVYGDPSGATFFAYDPENRNDLSSSQEESSGRLVFEQVGCEPTPNVELRVDVTLGSESFDLRSMDVEGTLRLGG